MTMVECIVAAAPLVALAGWHVTHVAEAASGGAKRRTARQRFGPRAVLAPCGAPQQRCAPIVACGCVRLRTWRRVEDVHTAVAPRVR